jgi:hypothetical protein
MHQRSMLGLFDNDLTGRSFAQSGHQFLVVGFDQGPGSFEQLFGPLSRYQHQLEAVGNMPQAVFDCDSSHRHLSSNA